MNGTFHTWTHFETEEMAYNVFEPAQGFLESRPEFSLGWPMLDES